jgi:endonuclease G
VRAPNPQPFLALARDEELREEFQRRYPPTSAPGRFAETSGGLETLASVAAQPELEAIIQRFTRPSLLIFGGDFEVPTSDTWRARLDPLRPPIKQAIPAVGRVEILNYALDYVGTAWMIRPDVAVTNRHVASLFATPGNGVFPLALGATGSPFEVDVDFLEELDNPSAAAVRVEEVLFISDARDTEPDLAFLRLRSTADSLPLPLVLSEASAHGGEVVVTIGYPAQDYRQDPDDQARIFQDVYNVKRLAPGEITGVTESALHHDCTTLGGSSGSVVFCPALDAAVGLHFAGTAGVANFAVPASTVEDYCQRHVEGTPSAVGPTRPQELPAEAESPATAAELAARNGYDESFLGNGFVVPFPLAASTWRQVATPLLDDPTRFRLDYQNFSLVMHVQRRLALVTATNIDGEALVRVKRDTDAWYYDPRIPKEAQCGAELYDANPLDRGHLVRRLDPAFGRPAQANQAVEDTFHWTNCAPQHETFNRSLWASLEDYLLESAATHGFRASIFTGPVFADGDPDYRGIAQLPQAFWKVALMLADGANGLRLSTTGYVISQESFVANVEFAYGPFRTYQVPVSRITRWAGLRFGDDVEAADPMRTEESPFRYREFREPSDLLL